ncbi:hypothetical protein COX59_00440 [Candidatus Beckwithbacteria bacterium CG_4_10_14_0_2_um_filter_47_25]|uniref:NYN domain-containing protein n=3 Tax=Candidatus Beckwithiibacteriota TaxID=1752726 RepID=A0A2H0B5I3_9BACT|nr:MAG: hypothetical protein COX09_02305 [Candidatus Beckwithbacteria bacterium CG23_combo_of_CG06-09_8_20_14_all_47_9]PJA23337.1 MAG: hypothetical protein COX59_00440 [Candidatus Beckwithbacteria bacterium CG_4_10_14_0_2_um_filter_47_25]
MMKKIKKTTNLYIDGTNLFAGQNDLFGPRRHLDFAYLIKEIKKITSIDKVFFYASYMNSKQRERLAGAEALFYRQVKETKGLFFYKGHRSPSSGKEKGVDVHLSVDIVRDVFLFNCKKVVIMSGDSDLIYPLEIAKSCQIDTAAIFLPNRFSLEMAYQADQAFVFNFMGKFKYNRKLPRSLKIVSIKKPRTINVRGR